MARDWELEYDCEVWLIRHGYKYIARYRSGKLVAFRLKPHKKKKQGVWEVTYMNEWDDVWIVDLETDPDDQLFPKVQWDDEAPRGIYLIEY